MLAIDEIGHLPYKSLRPHLRVNNPNERCGGSFIKNGEGIMEFLPDTTPPEVSILNQSRQLCIP